MRKSTYVYIYIYTYIYIYNTYVSIYRKYLNKQMHKSTTIQKISLQIESGSLSHDLLWALFGSKAAGGLLRSNGFGGRFGGSGFSKMMGFLFLGHPGQG